MAQPPADQRFEAERWFRAQGLPLFVRPRRRGVRLVERSAPMLAFVALAALALIIFDRLATAYLAELTEDSDDYDDTLFILLGVCAILVVAAIVIAVVVAGLTARRRGWARLIGLAAMFLLVVIEPFLGFGPSGTSWWELFTQNLLAVVLILLLTWLGVGAFLAWSLKSAIHQLSAIWLLASVALPLLILVVIFAFYSQETWQMSASLAKGRMFWLLSFLGAVGVLFVIYSARKEIAELPQAIDETTLVELRDELQIPQDESGLSTWRELSFLEKTNVTIVIVLAQLFQVLIFGVLVFAFLMALSSLSITPAIAQTWAGVEVPQLTLLGYNVPIPQVQVRVSSFLAAIASLNFVVSVNSSKAYRDAFYDPLLARTGKALVLHTVYGKQNEPGDDQVVPMSAKEFTQWFGDFAWLAPRKRPAEKASQRRRGCRRR